MNFERASKKKVKLRMALDGPSGSGKTYTALEVAKAFAGGKPFAVIDTEFSSASLYADNFEFDVLDLDTFHPQRYIDAIHAAEKAGYPVIVIDSLSHAWEGKGGALELVDEATAKNRGNSFAAWRTVTPLQHELVEAILSSPAHIIATMRSKMDYAQEKDSGGKTIIRKVGMQPIQRPGIEYEFTIVGDMDLDHTLVISKSRISPISGKVFRMPKEEDFYPLIEWLNSGVVPAEQPKVDVQVSQLEPAQPDPYGDEMKLAYWHYCRDELGWTKEQAKEFSDGFEGNWYEAYVTLQEKVAEGEDTQRSQRSG